MGKIILSFIGFSSGLVISGAVFAFIAIIGVVPRLAQKTKTVQYLNAYETAIILGGIFGSLTNVIKFSIPIGNLSVIFSLAIGIFFGCLAVSLTEILDAVPVLVRRTKIKTGLFFLILAIALGKMTGSLLYYIMPGFYTE